MVIFPLRGRPKIVRGSSHGEGKGHAPVSRAWVITSDGPPPPYPEALITSRETSSWASWAGSSGQLSRCISDAQAGGSRDRAERHQVPVEWHDQQCGTWDGTWV